MVLDPIPQSLPVHFFGSRPQPRTSLYAPHVYGLKPIRRVPCDTHIHVCCVLYIDAPKCGSFAKDKHEAPSQKRRTKSHVVHIQAAHPHAHVYVSCAYPHQNAAILFKSLSQKRRQKKLCLFCKRDVEKDSPLTGCTCTCTCVCVLHADALTRGCVVKDTQSLSQKRRQKAHSR